jgi:hypothetical protein
VGANRVAIAGAQLRSVRLAIEESLEVTSVGLYRTSRYLGAEA